MSRNLPDSSSFPIDGIAEWLMLVERALQGVHHGLSNRLGALSAIVELHQLGDVSGADVTGFEGLARELVRLEDCSRVVRLLASDSMREEESLILNDVITDVLAIHRYLHEWRDLGVRVVPTTFVEPVRTPRWALIRALVMLLADVKDLACAHGGAVQIVATSDEERVTVHVKALGIPEGLVPEGRGPYATLLAEVLGGGVTRRPGVVELTLPTLKSRRAAERQ